MDPIHEHKSVGAVDREKTDAPPSLATPTPSFPMPMEIAATAKSDAPPATPPKTPSRSPFATTAIASFDPQEIRAPGFAEHSEQNLKSTIGRARGRRFDAFSLSKPSVRGDFCVLGTDDPQGEDRQDHVICCVDWRHLDGAPQSWIALNEPVRDIHWDADDLVIAATGDGAIRVIQVSTDYKMVERARFTDLHFDAVREIALNKAQVGQFASGGFDKRLCLVDINKRDRLLQTVKLDNVIGSVRWPTCNQNVCVSCTLDTGAYLVFDIRQALRQPAFQATMGKPDLHAHERYTDHHVIMGFGDGEIQHIDMRITNRILHKVQDPYVEGIGWIEYKASSASFAVSGSTDFSCWKHTPDRARIWSHQFNSTSVAANTNGYSTAAVWGDDNNVVVSTSSGSIGVFRQDWSETFA